MTKEIPVVRGSGNVFADLGLSNPEEERLKAALAREIRSIIKRRKLTQVRAANLLGIVQPDASALVNGRLTKFSLERLLKFMPLLDRDVQIVVKAKPRTRPACMTVAVASMVE